MWEALPEAHALPAEAAAPRETAPALAFELPDLAPDAVARALETATTFPRRVTPHALVVPPPEEAKPERATEQEEAAATADSPAILYGTWWHELVQGVPWAEPREEWQRRFTAALALIAAAKALGARVAAVPRLAAGRVAGAAGTAGPGRMAVPQLRRGGYVHRGRDGPRRLVGERRGVARDRLEDEPRQLRRRGGPW
ncbi:MAG: hypothetical protein WDO13_20090 [Verrucomicrobiota bacterium]